MMKKSIIAAAVSVSVALVAAQDSKSGSPLPKLAPGEFEARAIQNYERRSGGTVRKPGSARGVVLVVNSQDKVGREELEAALRHIDETVHPILEYKEAQSVNSTCPTDDIKQLGGKVGVVLVDVENTPALLVAPEEGWAVVNVRKLAKDNPSKEILSARTRKELLRGFALACGGAFMARGQMVVREGIRTAKDLDAVPDEEYGVDIQMALERGLPLYGVMPWKQTTYKKACKEGWAPPPTNAAQQAIWNKIRAIPDKPITIEYDPKVDK